MPMDLGLLRHSSPRIPWTPITASGILIIILALLGTQCSSAGRRLPNPVFRQQNLLTPELVAQTASPDPDQRRRAVLALGEGELEGVDAARARVLLAAVLRSDGEPLVRAAAATSLGRAGSPAVLGPLKDGLRDPSALVRADSVRALGTAAIPGAVAPLIETLKTDTSSDVRCAAAAALARFKSPRARKALLEALDDERLAVRSAASRALSVSTGAKGLPPKREAWEAWFTQREQEKRSPRRFLFW